MKKIIYYLVYIISGGLTGLLFLMVIVFFVSRSYINYSYKQAINNHDIYLKCEECNKTGKSKIDCATKQEYDRLDYLYSNEGGMGNTLNDFISAEKDNIKYKVEEFVKEANEICKPYMEDQQHFDIYEINFGKTTLGICPARIGIIGDQTKACCEKPEEYANDFFVEDRIAQFCHYEQKNKPSLIKDFYLNVDYVMEPIKFWGMFSFLLPIIGMVIGFRIGKRKNKYL